MRILYIVGGFLSTGVGLCLIAYTIYNYKKGYRSEFGWDMRIFTAGLGFVIGGAFLLSRYL